jgi:RimJ/RimL family protein N-acetyltransferase
MIAVVTDSVPSITTARLTLRQLVSADVDALAAIYADREVTRYYRVSEWDYTLAREFVDGRLNRQRNAPHGQGSFIFESAGRIVGMGHVLPSSELPGGLPEAGWMLGREHWGSGLASEGARAVLDYALRELSLPAVWALVHEDNKRSLAMARRLGFLDVGAGHHYNAWHRVLVVVNGQPLTGDRM